MACGLQAERRIGVTYAETVVHPESRIRPASESPVRVTVGAPGRGPRSVAARRRAERAEKSLFGGSQRAGRSATRRESCSLVTVTTGSRAAHFVTNARVRPLRFRASRRSAPPGYRGSGTYARSGWEQKTVSEPYAGKWHMRIERGMGKRDRFASAVPLTTSSQEVAARSSTCG